MEKMETCRRRWEGLAAGPDTIDQESLVKPLTTTTASSCSSSPPYSKFGKRGIMQRGPSRSLAIKASVVGSAAIFVGGKLHDFVTRVPLPEPCQTTTTTFLLGSSFRSRDASTTPEFYHNVPGSLDLFRDNRVICPKQTAETLRVGSIASASPNEWAEYRDNVQRAGQGWKGKGSGQGLIVFKRGGSGSTWFDSLLGNHPDLDFRHEAHHSVFAPFHGPAKATQRMRNFLTGGKKCRSEQGYCGFSISPTKHADGVDWAEIVRVSGASVVVFVRTNVIKRLLGLERKSLVHALPKRCRTGSSYKPEMKNDPGCAMNKTVVMAPVRILNGAEEASLLQAWDLIETALSTGAPFQILSYEGMQQNMTETFDRLAAFSGWPLSTFDWSSHQKTAKVSSEDLRESISNYDEVEQWLVGKPCFLDMLHSGNKQIFPLCNAPRNYTVLVGADDSEDGDENDKMGDKDDADQEEDDADQEEEAEGA